MRHPPGYDFQLPAKLIEVQPRTGTLYQLPAYGYLEEILIRWPDPVPNMDAANLYEMLVERLPPGFQVFVKVRSAAPGTGGNWSVQVRDDNSGEMPLTVNASARVVLTALSDFVEALRDEERSIRGTH